MKPLDRRITMQAQNFYTIPQIEALHDLYRTYHNRGGVLLFIDFSMIPIIRTAGNMANETGTWTKYIRQKLAAGWDNIKAEII